MYRGSVRIYRKIKENEIWDNPKYLKGFLFILLATSYKDGSYTKKDFSITIKRGQMFMSIKKMQQGIGFKTEDDLFNFLDVIKENGTIDYEVIEDIAILVTLINYDLYQSFKPKEDKKQKTTRENLKKLLENCNEFED